MNASHSIVITKCPSTDEWRNQIRYSHSVECYAATKRNEVLTHATTLAGPRKHDAKGDTLNRRGHVLYAGKPIETEGRLVAARGRGLWTGE